VAVTPSGMGLPSSVLIVFRKNRTTEALAACPPWFFTVVVTGNVKFGDASVVVVVSAVGMRSGPTTMGLAVRCKSFPLVTSVIGFTAFAWAKIQYLPGTVFGE